MQLEELMVGIDNQGLMIVKDYRHPECSDSPQDIVADLETWSAEELLDLGLIARALGYGGGLNNLDVPVTPRGYRVLHKIPRLPQAVIENMVQTFQSLPEILEASIDELDDVEGIGEVRARAIKEGLRRLREQALLRSSFLGRMAGRLLGVQCCHVAGAKKAARCAGHASLGQVEDTQRGDTLALILDEAVEIEAKDIAQTGEIKERAADLLLEHLDTMLAHFALDVGGHMLLDLPVADVGGNLRLAGVDLNATAGGDGFCHGSIDAGAGLLKLGEDVEDAPVADQALRDGLLEG